MQEQMEVFEYIQDFFNKNISWIAGILIVLVAFGSIYGVMTYRRSQAHQRAFHDFIQVNKMIEAPVHEQAAKDEAPHSHICFSTQDEKWAAVAAAAQEKLDLHGKSVFGAHFAIIKANSLLQQNKAEEALVFLKSNINLVPNSAVKEQLAAQKALMLIDSASAEEKQAGLKELEKIAQAGGIASDFAYYWLGQYHWTSGNQHEAKLLWNSMLAENNKLVLNRKNDLLGSHSNSPWLKKARKLLATLQ